MKSGVSVVIVNWNGKKWLKKLFNTLSVQDFKKYEIILVDNASTDDSVNYTIRNFPNINIVESKTNLGFAGGNNLGIKHAQYENILLINSDTWIGPDFISSLLAEKARRKLDVIAPLEANYETEVQRKPYVTKIDLFGHPIFLPKKDNGRSFYLSGVSLLFEKALYINTGGLDENFFMYCEEVDWFWRLRLYGYNFDYSENTYIYHYGGGSSVKGINQKVFLWRTENTIKMLMKNYGQHKLMIILPLQYATLICESAIFTLIGKPSIGKTYINAIKNVRSTKYIIKESRNEIQSRRKLSDKDIRKDMYTGIAKFHHLKFFIKSKMHG